MRNHRAPYTVGCATNCIADSKRHHACTFQSNSSSAPSIKTIDLSEGRTFRYKSDKYEIMLLVSGTVMLRPDRQDELILLEKHLFLLPPDVEISLYALHSSLLILFRMLDDVCLCPGIDISGHRKQIDWNDRSIHVLPFKPPIERFSESLSMAIKDGLCCELYLKCKSTELIFLLRTLYSEPEQADMFRLLLQRRSDFQINISRIESEVKSAREMADRCYMTEVGFRKKFKREMGISPGAYLIERKKRLIAKDLRLGVKSNNDLCYEYGFSCASGLTNFCRIHLGGTPSHLRKSSIAAMKMQRDALK